MNDDTLPADDGCAQEGMVKSPYAVAESDETLRASRALDMMNQSLRALTAAERDQRLQWMLAQAMGEAKRFRAAGALFNMLLSIRAASAGVGRG